MKCSIWYDLNWNFEITNAYIQHSPSVCKNIEIKWEEFEFLLNCEIETRNRIIQQILDNLPKNEKCKY